MKDTLALSRKQINTVAANVVEEITGIRPAPSTIHVTQIQGAPNIYHVDCGKVSVDVTIDFTINWGRV